MKKRFYTFINISGLSVGIVCSILIMLWVVDELSYDKFIPKSDRLYQVWVNADFDSQINSWRSVPLPTYEAMKTADHHIAKAAVTGWGYDHLLTVGETRIMKKAYYASEEFLEMFEFPLVYGDKETVMDDPSSIIITESTAKALFGDENPINKVIRVDDSNDLKVTGILKDVPSNSSFEFDFLLTWKHRAQINEWVVDNQDNWGNYSFQIFLELDDPQNKEAVEASVKDMLIEHGEVDMHPQYFLYPMERWRLYSNFENGKENGGMIEYVQLFTIIAVFILVIACINFMNLATARSEKRAREVGIRKSMGSKRSHLIMQFLGESFVITTLAFIIAILITLALLPFYNDMVDKQLSIDFTSANFWILSLGIIFFTSMLAGSYPAFYLSSFKPVTTLKGKIALGKSAGVSRKALVVLQFGVAIILMTGTIIIYQQVEMVKNRDLGYDKERLIMVDYTQELKKNFKSLKNELLQSGSVESMTVSNSGITSVNSNNFLSWPGKPEDLKVIFSTITTEYDYTETMGIKILEGRDFSEDFASDSNAIIVNKAALDLMGLEDPIGTQLELWGDKRTLIGVVDNVLMESVYRDVKPLFMVLQDWGGTITIRLNKNQNLQASLQNVESIFKKFNPAYPFDFSFVDVEFEKKFNTIILTRKLASIFAVLAIFITCMGLLGLVSYTAEQRTKEIGIRKVLGATVPGLITLISKDFTKLVLIAFAVSGPLSWWLLDKYLERYPLRIDISWWLIPAIGVVILCFALVIVTFQAHKAAQANPVKSLRSE